MKKILQKRNVARSAIAEAREAGRSPAGLTCAQHGALLNFRPEAGRKTLAAQTEEQRQQGKSIWGQPGVWRKHEVV